MACVCVIRSRAGRNTVVALKPLQSDLKLCLQSGAAAGTAFLGHIVPLMAKTNLAALAAPEVGCSQGLMVQKDWGEFDEKMAMDGSCRLFGCALRCVWSRLQAGRSLGNFCFSQHSG